MIEQIETVSLEKQDDWPHDIHNNIRRMIIMGEDGVQCICLCEIWGMRGGRSEKSELLHTNNSSSVLAEKVDSKHHNALKAAQNIINWSFKMKVRVQEREGG